MRSIRRALTVLVLLAAVLAPVRSQGSSWSEERPEDISRFSLAKVSFEGELSISEDKLRDAIKSSTSGLLRFRPVDIDRIEGDVILLRNHFRRNGFWNVIVERRIEFLPEKRQTRVIFEIEEGAERRVGDVSVSGARTFPTAEVFDWTRTRKGQKFDLALASRDRTAIENNYANRGFYEVQVIADVQAPTPANPGEPIVHGLIFRVTEGPRYIVGKIEVAGNRFTLSKIIRRELKIESGQVLSREQISESRSRLYSTGYFSRVNIVPQTETLRQGVVDVAVQVVERKMRYVGLGLGYGTQDQLRLSGEWGHRNLLGRAKRATLRATLATELFPVDLVRTRLEGRYVEPWLFGTRTTGIGKLSFERRPEFIELKDASTPQPDSSFVVKEYDLNLVGLVLNANRQLSRYSRGWVSLEQEWADVDADFTTEGLSLAPDLTRTFSMTVERDRRDDYFEPKKGFVNRVSASVSGGVLGGDNDFWRVVAGMNWFRHEFGVTWAGRVRVGYEKAFGQSSRVEDRFRFKLGGATTVRGYSEREVELTIGPGDFMLLANVEARVPLFWLLQGAVFLDGGNAWQKPSDVRLEDFKLTGVKDDPELARETEFRYSTGVGIRIATPVGPIRLDVARKLKLVEFGEDRYNFHLSLGHVF